MHISTPSDKAPVADTSGVPWYRELNRTHWFVLVVASLGWLFDTMDQQLFNLARRPAIVELLGPGASPAAIAEYSGYATMIFIIGWATGGVYFGILGDRIGRAKTMVYTILLYSMFTGLSVLSVGVWDFSFYRFLTGLGVGGQFAVGVALVAETLPDRARPYALGWLQASSALGNMLAALAGIALGQMQSAGMLASAWRAMFLVGALPAFLCIIVFRKLKEPERWQREAKAGAKRGSMGELFSDPRWRYNATVGMLLAFAGVVGLWGIGFFSFVGRRPAFALAFVAAMLSTAFTFWNLNDFTDIFWMIPLMGFCQLSLFGGYAIYLPELFPTRLRSTGTSFCYNVGRFVAAVGPLALGLLTSRVFAGYPEPMRYAGVTMCRVFLIGLATVPFAPETKGRPLPE
jgi:MFS family permease